MAKKMLPYPEKESCGCGRAYPEGADEGHRTDMCACEGACNKCHTDATVKACLGKKKRAYEEIAEDVKRVVARVKRTGVPEMTAFQCPHGRKKPRIEVEGIWTDGEVHGKRCVSLCSTGVAMLYLAGQRHKACKAKLWLVRFFVNGKLVREWDEINQKYHLEVA